MSFSPGEAVRVKDDWPETRGPAHIRTPHYLRGHTGRVVRPLGDHPNPEDLAFARPAANRALYHVTFPMRDIWPEENATGNVTGHAGGHAGAQGGDALIVELYEHWLERP